jgi:hypothetical protein
MPPFGQLPSQQIDLPDVAPPTAPATLNFQMAPQKGTNWCWAAVASSVSKCLAAQGNGASYEQCQVASRVLPNPPPAVATPDCCCNGGTANCPGNSVQYNLEADLAQALQQIQHFSNAAGLLDFDTIEDQIVNQHKPVCVRFAYTAGDAHLVAICDAHRDPSGTAIYVLADPRYADTYPQSAVTLMNSYRGQSGNWTDTYLTQ